MLRSRNSILSRFLGLLNLFIGVMFVIAYLSEERKRLSLTMGPLTPYWFRFFFLFSYLFFLVE